MAELDEERECCRRELIVAIMWAGVHNGASDKHIEYHCHFTEEYI